MILPIDNPAVPGANRAVKTKGKVVRIPSAFETQAPPGSLYALTGTYLEAQTKLMEIDLDPKTIADTLESLEGDVAAKALRVVAIAQQFDAFALAIAERAAGMAKRAKDAQARAEGLRQYVLESLKVAGFDAGDTIESPEIRLRLQKNPPKCHINDETALPKFYWRTPPQPADVLDKAAILEDLKTGANIPGAELKVEIRMVEK